MTVRTPARRKNFALEASVNERAPIEGGENAAEADHKDNYKAPEPTEIQPRDDTNVQEQTRQANQQNWNKTESLSKAVPKAGQQQQEHRTRHAQETSETSVPLEPPFHGRGRGGRSAWCQGSGMGCRSPAGLRT